MKLYLKIASPNGHVRSFDHAGSILRVGRDPSCELSLQGEEGHVVSWNHAQIELSAAGATVADAGSSNGTLLNDQRIERPVPLRVGDRVQLGHTGVTLTITGLDFTAAVPPPSSSRPLPATVLVAGAAGAAVVLLVALILINKWSGKPSDELHVQRSPKEGAGTPDNKDSSPPAEKGPLDRSGSGEGATSVGKMNKERPTVKPDHKTPGFGSSTSIEHKLSYFTSINREDQAPGFERQQYVPVRRQLGGNHLELISRSARAACHPETNGDPTCRVSAAKDRPLENDFVSDEEFERLLDAWFGNIARVLEPGRDGAMTPPSTWPARCSGCPAWT
jgi:pSer/pThr/pTyr-binding forkhead associated (FHA) protein